MNVIENRPPQENGKIRLNRLTGLYHGTGFDGHIPVMLQTIGLLSEGKKTTLTGDLYRAKEYAEQKYIDPAISIWYPGRNEVSSSAVYFGIESEIDDADKAIAFTLIKSLDFLSSDKTQFYEKVKRSDKLLPSNRLGTIIGIPQGETQIIIFCRVMEQQGLMIFSSDPKFLSQKAKEIIRESIYYLRRDLSIDRLAEDMVRIGVETQLRLAGEALMYHNFPKVTERRSLAVWEEEKEKIRKDWFSFWAPRLMQIVFKEPDYESFRQVLLKMYQNGAPFL